MSCKTHWHADHIKRKGKEYYKTFMNIELPLVLVRTLDRKVERLDEIIFLGLVTTPASNAPFFPDGAPSIFYLSHSEGCLG